MEIFRTGIIDKTLKALMRLKDLRTSLLFTGLHIHKAYVSLHILNALDRMTFNTYWTVGGVANVNLCDFAGLATVFVTLSSSCFEIK